jgi:hypothetical protein
MGDIEELSSYRLLKERAGGETDSMRIKSQQKLRIAEYNLSGLRACIINTF